MGYKWKNQTQEITKGHWTGNGIILEYFNLD